ncbi:MAG: DNA polymerase III subunit alpha, partial [Planctomycetes bacterium]|nr:DNA polymerase III subunit alpha [Planctomycetota bacterium]
KSVDLIEQSTGERVDPYAFPLDDQPTFDLLCRGETKGIFQLESGGIRDLLQRMKPDHFRDIIATNALYRPGPLEGGMVTEYIEVKHGRKQAEYAHPVMKEVLEETHGVMVYQEQVMRILNGLGGIELSEAYTCIKAISKKKLPMIARSREQFIQGAVAKGLKERDASELFGMIEKFAGYGFNKSHSTAYALIAYMTAYLKAHYPVEFMAALLSGDIPGRNFKKKDSLVEHLEDCRRMNITVVPPDVNQCEGDFTVRDQKILFGLAAIKGFGPTAAAAVVADRTQRGPYRDLFDFCQRIDPSVANRGAIESLIKAGAFDSCGAHRAAWMGVVDRALQSGASALSDRRAGQKGLFEDDEPEDGPEHASVPNVPPWDDRLRLASEKEVLGFYLSSHPLAEHEEALSTYTTHNTVEAAALPGRTEVFLGGMIASIKFSHVKQARQGSTHTKYAMFDLEDMTGIMRSIIWPEDFARFAHLVEADKILVVRGTVDKRPGSEEANLIINELIPLEEVAQRFTKGMIVRLDEQEQGLQRLDQLHEILRGYPGKCELQLMLCLEDKTRVLCHCDGMRVELSAELRQRVGDLLGPGHIKLIGGPSPSAPSNGNGNGYNRGQQNRGAPARR